MDASPYLAQAIAAMQAPVQTGSQGGSQITPEQMAMMRQKADAFHKANPNGNFMGHQMMQAGRNMMGAPDRLAAMLQGAQGQIPGQPPGVPGAPGKRGMGGAMPPPTGPVTTPPY